jgi:hypothetical protein
MPKLLFKTAAELKERIDAYFEYIQGERDVENTSKQAIRIREPATFTGLIIFIGFDSKQTFEKYEQKGKFSRVLRQGRLQIEYVYEQQLHLKSSSAGARFALKSMGWNDKPKPPKEKTKPGSRNLNVKIFQAGPIPAEVEKDVNL